MPEDQGDLVTHLALVLLAALAAADPPAAPGPIPSAPVAPRPEGEPRAAGDSIGSLLSEPASVAEREGSAGGLLFRVLGWMAALTVAAVAGIGIWKRLTVTGRTGGEAGGIRVVGRAALTPKHSIYTVRVSNQRLLVVGVSGDRMTSLTEFDDPAQVLALDSSFQKALSAAGGREEAVESAEGGSALLDGQLTPYRVEVRKLVEVVRGWRGRLGRALGAEAKARTGD
jgi:flagellar biogenesis protein FliO